MEKYLDLKNNNDYNKLKEAANIIKNGGTVVFPTETVYGIGTNGLDSSAVEKIFKAKGRAQDNPINLLVSDINMVEQVAQNITELEYKLMESFFPGPFTIILHKRDCIPSIVTANQNTIGVRIPDNIITRKLIEYSGVPIAAPSANISGKPSGTNFNDIYNDFKNKVDYIIDGGNSSIGLESTIVKVIDGIPHILRPGSITIEQIEKVSGCVCVKDYETPSSIIPSNKYKHYSLNTKSFLVYSDNNEKMIAKIKEISSDYISPIIICNTENADKYDGLKVISMGNTFEEIAQNLFATLNEADNLFPDLIIIEGVKQQGLGIAIMNRLLKVCQDNLITI